MVRKPKTPEAAYNTLVKTWRSKAITDRVALERELADYAVRFSYNSGRIENPLITYHDTRAVFEDGKAVGYSGDVRTLFEIQNLKLAYEKMLDCFAAKEPITEKLVLEFHQVLTQGTYDEHRWENGERPGEYKHHDYVVGVHDAGLPAASVPSAIKKLCKELSAAAEDNILISAAYFHMTFESIHPFADGNGRCGRALMNYLLVLNNHPPITIFDEDKLAYYGVFDAWDTEADLAPALEFLKVEAIKTFPSFIE